ncbi:MAG: Stp1/IreP family PP2C-type Ser/Thr phosphatase [Ruminococcaceae bacterium]|nr:Stp1/IreP family PP2C-type Ser/Thr phosphatase [Oscillospiraceae bacterium]
MKYFGNTHIGNVRDENQDIFGILRIGDGVCLTVCDGMGGENGGSIASSVALENYHEFVMQSVGNENVLEMDSEKLTDILSNGVKCAHEKVMEKARENEDLEGMGTTIVSAFVRDGHAFVVNVGDSRCYVLKDKKLSKVTKDHSLVQGLVDSGLITEEEAEKHPDKNCITKAVGIDIDTGADAFYVPSFEYILLCSDGLTNMVSVEEIKNIILDKIDPESAVCALIDKARENGGYDNITVALIKEEY